MHRTTLPGTPRGPPRGPRTFAPGEVVRTITVVVKGDEKEEGNETVCVALTGPPRRRSPGSAAPAPSSTRIDRTAEASGRRGRYRQARPQRPGTSLCCFQVLARVGPTNRGREDRRVQKLSFRDATPSEGRPTWTSSEKKEFTPRRDADQGLRLPRPAAGRMPASRCGPARVRALRPDRPAPPSRPGRPDRLGDRPPAARRDGCDRRHAPHQVFICREVVVVQSASGGDAPGEDFRAAGEP
jgi:hypothetical protein